MTNSAVREFTLLPSVVLRKRARIRQSARHHVLDNSLAEAANLRRIHITKVFMEGLCLKAESLEVYQATSPVKGSSLEHANQFGADALRAMLRIDPQLPQLAAQPPGASDGPPDDVPLASLA